MENAAGVCSGAALEPAGAQSECVAEQLDEVQLLEAMAGRDGEFQWRQTRNGRISGRLQVFLNLGDEELTVSVAKRERASGVSSTARHPRPLKHSRVAHLPPLSLHFELPPEYPMVAMPIFTLTCSWLNFSQLTALCQKLDSLWEEGCVVLYTWQQFLSTDTLTTLNLTSELVLKFEDPMASDSKRDKRAVQDMLRPSQLLQFLVEYDQKEREREFSESYFDCEICFCSLPGSKCRRVEPCRHIHCCDCLRQYLTTKIGSGEVTKLECPSDSCDTSLPLTLIQDLVSEEVFERFDRLLLQKTIDKMSDVVYCPRPSCRCVTLKEEDDTSMALCPRCRFSFCVLCKHSWHGVDPCKLLPTDIQEIRETWQSLNPEERRELQQQYGKDKLERAFQEHDSIQWLESNSRKCPNCQAKIQKALGCNKMTCTHCNCSFCWLCSTALPSVNPYRHFRDGMSKCAGRLFEGLTDSDEEDLWL